MSLVEFADKANLDFKSIPIINLEKLRSRNLEDRKALADQVRNACMNVGFFYVKNHGVPEVNISNVLDRAKEFFDLPMESKMKGGSVFQRKTRANAYALPGQIENKTTPNFKGYSPLLSGNNDPNNKGDLQEGFEFGWENLDGVADSSRKDDGIMTGANVWPSELPDFRAAALQYYHSLVDLGKLLFPIFALALNIEENFFEDKIRNSAALMRILHYPNQESSVDDGVLGIGAHTDWECFTILWQEPGIQALQVLNAQKEWINAPPIPGTFVVNLGDQFARWTNDVFKSTVHRVINKSGARRYSIPLFFGTDYDVKLEPIPSCVSTDRPPKYEVVTAGEYVKSRLQATYGH
ncbi:2og-fe oxygenase [Moniliophthora roreri MCA 2997]|uniref:2og-fe oxygenase n=1 Tax=Moniliophthora roreri (strain MCA 2997) TaxID=1381753 RepID=V2XZG4_MONRO|nr:2og-fe oxygenase [Moniliophthora roreri MCA 2997]